MNFVCIFLPALCAIGIELKRRSYDMKTVQIVIRYGIWVLAINFMAMLCVVYVFGIEGVLTDAMDSFSFACKYIVISLILSIVLPYIIEILGKYLRISFEVTSKDSEDEKKD